MSKRLVKIGIWLFVLGVFFLGGLAAILGSAQLVTYFQRGANPEAILNIVPNRPADWHSALYWLPDDEDIGREMEPFTRDQIESAYIRAWLQIHLSHIRGEPFGLTTYFVGPALTDVLETVQQPLLKGFQIEQADTTHTLQLHFYSADGSIVAFTDHEVRVPQIVRNSVGEIVVVREDQASYDVVMFLSDGNWRIRHWVRRELAEEPTAEKSTNPEFVTAEGMQLMLNGRPFQMAGINYYPQDTPWDLFWSTYDGAVIDRDLALIQSLGLNTVRIFIPFEQFGGAYVSGDMLAKLDNFLEQAAGRDLKVIVTLFDFRTDYRLIHWPEADRHAEALVGQFADHPAIMAWDIKNEPDLDYEAAQPERVNAWLVHMAETIRQIDSNHLITVGFFSPEAAVAQADWVDFVSFHYYEPANLLIDRITEVQDAAGEKPVALTEFGLPTWNPFYFPGGHSRQEQAIYYADILATLRASSAVGYAAWTLYDYSHVPNSVRGRLPWKRAPERHLGVIDRNGEAKAAAALLAPNASLQLLRPPFWARFLKPFWLTFFVTTLLFGWLLFSWGPALRRHFQARGDRQERG